jgi:hypothetical protein
MNMVTGQIEGIAVPQEREVSVKILSPSLPEL